MHQDADLLQPHQEGEDNAPAFDSLDVLKLIGKIVHGLLVERGLLAAQGAERLHLGLVGQFRLIKELLTATTLGTS
jgi:hypothetical protein